MEDASTGRRLSRVSRAAFLVLGLLATTLGFIGIFVPLMPTTVFLILAVACFARSSERLEAWLLNHPRLGPQIHRWRAHGAISPGAKIFAVAGMASGLTMFWYAVRPPWVWLLVAAAVLLASAAYVLTRPSGPSPEPPATRP